MKRSLAILCLGAISIFLLTVGQAGATARQTTAVKTVTVAMHDPGCHWFYAGGGPNSRKYLKTLSVKGPVALLNLDEATLKIVGPKGVRHVAVGKKLGLAQGSYRITMVGQAPDDNTLKLNVR